MYSRTGVVIFCVACTGHAARSLLLLRTTNTTANITSTTTTTTTTTTTLELQSLCVEIHAYSACTLVHSPHVFIRTYLDVKVLYTSKIAWTRACARMRALRSCVCQRPCNPARANANMHMLETRERACSVYAHARMYVCARVRARPPGRHARVCVW